MTRRPRKTPAPREGGKTSASREGEGLAARRAALEMIERVMLDGATLEEGGASGPERAAARTLADTVFRRLGQIDSALAEHMDRMPEGRGAAILRLMAGELLFGGTPPHAAVDSAVRLARGGKRTMRLAGLVNAVGRRLAEGGAELVAAQDAVRLDTPQWLADKLVADWGEDTAREIARVHLEPAPHDLTLAEPGDVEALARELDAEILPTGSLRLPGRPQISALPGFRSGAWWVQDAAAALPVGLLGDIAGKRVLDLCAAPGGKTLQMAAAGANVVAVDVAEGRMKRVRDNLSRTQQEAELVTADIMEWEPEGTFEAILLDAPCSASGTIRRHPELPWRTDGRGMVKLVHGQIAMLDRAARWLAPGGVLVFCTCSLFKAEGEDHVVPFLGRNPELVPDPLEEDALPIPFVRDGWLRTRPDDWVGRGGIDGFFAARFRRPG